MGDAYGNIIPARWVLPEKASKYEQQVFVNWLRVELPTSDAIAVKAKPLKGWRNAEVYYFIRFEWPDWTARMFQEKP